MKTKQRTLLGLLVLVLLLGGALALLTRQNQKAEQAASEAAQGAIPLSSFAADDLTEIVVTYNGETNTLHSADGGWTLAEDPAYHLDETSCNTMRTALAALNAKRQLTEEPGEDYGFTADSLTVTVTAAGETNTFTFGAENAATGDIYLKKAGDDALYTVAGTKASCFEVRKTDLFGAFNPAGLTSSAIEAVTLTKNGETLTPELTTELLSALSSYVTAQTTDGDPAGMKELAAAVEANKEIAFPLVVKAQVQVGGRGKAGGIKMADNMDELKNVAGQILGMNIKGHIVNRLMAVEKADVASEMYLSIMLDRLTKCPLLIFSPAGGVEIEETAKTNPELIFKVPVNPLSGMTADITSDMASKAGLTGKTAAQFEEVLCKLYDFFRKRDCLLAEINPLAVDHDGNIVVLDGKVYSAPVIQDRIAGGKASITGNFTTEEAQDLAIVLRAGSLPTPVSVLEERTVGPSLGKESINSGIKASLVGAAAVVLVMPLYYGLSGLIADVMLCFTITILLAGMTLFGATLTLPGIAGIVLTIGMSVDANVLIFERIREETKHGLPMPRAIEAGFREAQSSILDSNLTTLLTAAVLYQFGTGPIRGFAVTLALGILASMFTAIFVSHLLFDVWIRRNHPVNSGLAHPVNGAH